MSKPKKLITGTKKEILEDIQKVSDEFYKKNKKEITRTYYRDKGKYSETLIEKLFGSFTEAKKCIIIKDKNNKEIKRENINISVTNKDKNKKYFVSAIIPKAKVNKVFWKSILNYCEHNNAQPILLVMRGVLSEDTFDSDIYEEFSKYFFTEYKFNDNLIAKDFMLSPQQILPLTGLHRYGGRKNSVIVAHSKQMLSTIPKQHNDFPHLVFSTGTICDPVYRNTRQGQIAKEDNCLGGFIIDVEDSTSFHQRAIRFDGCGFQDLNIYYTPNRVENKNVNSLIIEPHFGVESEKALNVFKDVINVCNPCNIFMHDTFDSLSINPHIKNKIGLRIQTKEHQKSLKLELDYLGLWLQHFQSQYPKIKFYHVHSNHNYFIDRYLHEGEFIKDKENVVLGAELFLYHAKNINPMEQYLRNNFTIDNHIFLKKGESFIINGCEMNTHSHVGSNGSKGTLRNIETAYNNAIIGHSHSYNIWRDILQIPCVCELQQLYNIDGASSWLHGNGILFENGMKQGILYINGKWRLE